MSRLLALPVSRTRGPRPAHARAARSALPSADAGVWAALALGCIALPAGAQARPDLAQVASVRSAAFDHWWPKYKRLMDTLRENQDVDSGRLQVPPPLPADLRDEIHVAQGFRNQYLPGYTFYGVHTQGAVFEGLFLKEPAGDVRVLVNHDDPEDRKPILEDAYVDHMNRILRAADVRVERADQAASLARFFLTTFFNFNVHPEAGVVDSTVQDELRRVRILSHPAQIPQGRRVLQFGPKRAHLVFEPVPPAVGAAIRPPTVKRTRSGFTVEVFTWHPVRGEVKGWEILIEDDQFRYFRDHTVERWKPYRFEGLDGGERGR